MTPYLFPLHPPRSDGGEALAYDFTVPLRVRSPRGSVPPSWLTDFKETQVGWDDPPLPPHTSPITFFEVRMCEWSAREAQSGGAPPPFSTPPSGRAARPASPLILCQIGAFRTAFRPLFLPLLIPFSLFSPQSSANLLLTSRGLNKDVFEALRRQRCAFAGMHARTAPPSFHPLQSLADLLECLLLLISACVYQALSQQRGVRYADAFP